MIQVLMMTNVAFDIENNFGYVFDNDGDPVNTHIGVASSFI